MPSSLGFAASFSIFCFVSSPVMQRTSVEHFHLSYQYLLSKIAFFASQSLAKTHIVSENLRNQ